MAVLVPLGLFGAAQIQDGIRTYMQERLRDDMNYANAVQVAFANYVQGVWAMELLIGGTITRGGADGTPEDPTAYLRESLLDYPSADYLSWLGPDGSAIASTDATAADLPLVDQDYFQRVLHGQDEVVSDLILTRITQTPTVVIARGIRSQNGRLLGVVIVGVDARRLGTELPASFPDGTRYALVDRLGTIVYLSGDPNISLDSRRIAPTSPASVSLHGLSATDGHDRSLDGMVRLGAIVPVPGMGWAAYASTPVAVVLAEARRTAAQVALALFLVAAGSMLAAVWISNRLLRPVRALDRAAAAIAAGTPPDRVALEGTDELAAVTQTFDRMAQRIQEAQQQLQLRAAQQEAIARLGQQALARVDLAVLLEEAVALTARTVGVEYGTICEAGPDGHRPRVRATFGLEAARHAVSSASEGLGCRYLDAASSLEVAIPGREGPFGVLGLYSVWPRRFTSDDLHFTESVANLIAVAVARCRAEDELSESNERFRTLIATSPVPIITTDGDRVTTWNPAAERLFGWAMGEVIGQPLPFIPAAQWDQEIQLRARLANGEKAIRATARRRRRDGFTMDVIVTAARLVDAHGRPQGEVRVEVDITDRNRFLQVAAHELRNPMAAIKGTIGLIRRRQAHSPDAADTNRLAEVAEREIDRLGGLLSEILDAFRLQDGHLELKLQRVDLAQVVRCAVEPFAAVGTHPIVLGGIEDEPMWVVGDHRRLEEVVRNVLSNAVKYSPSGTEIHVTVARTGTSVRVSVADQGVGIPPEQTDRVFEPFFRGTNLEDATDPGGLGLGLFICRDVVRRHGGRIWVESVPGHGSTFHVEIPTAGQTEADCPQ